MVNIEIQPSSLSFRDGIAILRRNKWKIAVFYAATLALAAAYCFFWPPSYEAKVHVLIKHDREDPVVSSDQNSVRTLAKLAVTEEDLNSEQAIFKSRAVLERTVLDTAFDKAPEHWLVKLLNAPIIRLAELYNSYHHQPGSSRLERGIDRLSGKLNVLVEKKSAVISVEVRGSSPQQAKTLLESLVRNYVTQHLAVHRSANAQDVFFAEAERRRQQLEQFESRMEKLGLGATTGGITLERDTILRQAAELETEWRRAAALTRESEAKVSTEENQLKQLPERVVSQDRTVPNEIAVGNLSSQVLSLQLKSGELAAKYLPESRLVKRAEVERERAENLLRAETENPMHEQTRALNQVFEAVKQDLLMDRAASKGSAMREGAMLRSYEELRNRLAKTNRATSEIQALDRERHALEEAYQLYRKRYEESRMEDQMNQSQVANVSAIEPVYVDSAPVKPNIKIVVKLTAAAGLLAGLLLALLCETLANRIKNSEHLEALIGAPVLATILGRDFRWEAYDRQV